MRLGRASGRVAAAGTARASPLSSAPDTAARLRSVAKGTTMSDAGGCPRWMCQAGLASRARLVLPREGAQRLVVLVHRLGITSQCSRFAVRGLPYMK